MAQPIIGERKTLNGVTGEWDGTQWREVVEVETSRQPSPEDVSSLAASIGLRRKQGERRAGVSDFASEATRGLGPSEMASGAYQMLTSPMQTLKSLAAGHDELRQKGMESLREGRYIPAARQFTEYGLPLAAAGIAAAYSSPVTVPAAALAALSAGGVGLASSLAAQGSERASDYFERGQYAKGAGAGLNTVAQAALPEMMDRGVRRGLRAVEDIGNKRVGAVSIPFDVMDNADYARSKGIPVGASEQTGSRALLGLEDVTGRSLLRMFSEPAQRAKQTAAIAADIDRISASISGRKLDLYGASEGITKALKNVETSAKKAATAAYAPVEAAEATASVVKNPKAAYRKAYDR